MQKRYNRNRIYLTNADQKLIKKYPVLIAGGGIGSVIAECALRFGFESITIVDGDQVELTNLNRQNYTESHIGDSKAKTLYSRLKAINKEANIRFHHTFITEKNMTTIVNGHKVAINALDFTSNIPLIFDQHCQKLGVSVLHPYNLGWGGLLAVISPNGAGLDSIANPGEKFNEITMVKYASGYLKFWGDTQNWIDDVLKAYLQESQGISPPQLSIASWMLGAMCTHVLYSIATEKKIKCFPELYFSSIMGS